MKAPWTFILIVPGYGTSPSVACCVFVRVRVKDRGAPASAGADDMGEVGPDALTAADESADMTKWEAHCVSSSLSSGNCGEV